MKVTEQHRGQTLAIAVAALGLACTAWDARGAAAGVQQQYSIMSVGTVRGVTKVLTLEGIRRKTWAKYALWSNDNRNIYFKAGEKFYGHVHSNTPLWFSGDPEFFADCTSASTNIGSGASSTNSVIFHNGLRLGVATDTMASVNFGDLLGKADLVLTGNTTVVLSGTNLLISNSRRSWADQTNAVSSNSVIYVMNSGTGPDKYDVTVSGKLDGRVTIVSERDINITNHVTYASDPKTNAACNDALGLISSRDIVVKPSCPNNLKIYAHMMATGQYDPGSATDGSFGVEGYDSGSPRGDLIVHGGIVQDYRGAVGTFNTGSGTTVTGYQKNYTYDSRFATDPPPEYPPLSNELVFQTWKDK